METIYSKRLATFPDSKWDLFATVEREANGRTFRALLILGSGGTILGTGLSRKNAVALASRQTCNVLDYVCALPGA